jgi:putative ABC transport system substrate-binding protein
MPVLIREGDMRRREFIGGVGATALFGSRGVWGQQGTLPVIGYISNRSFDESTQYLAAFHQGLKESDYIEGKNVTIEYRWGAGRIDRIPAMVEDLISHQVAVILAAGSNEGLVAKAATKTIPIVFTGGSDPVSIGLVSSLNRPEGNVTGATIVSHLIGAKRLEVLRLLVPNSDAVAMLFEPSNPSAEALVKDTQVAARAIGIQIMTLAVDSETSLAAAFAVIEQQKASALLIGGGPILNVLRHRITALAAQHRLPAMYSVREYVDGGGLMSYGGSFADAARQAGIYVGRIIKGEKPTDLPVTQPTKFDLVINLKTAMTLGLTVPDKLIALADEVIE